MIQTRNVCTAFLKNRGDFLLMKRSASRKIAPGYWYGVGGHLEPSEINNPQMACLREIHEESGIRAEDISDLQLKYIVIRRSRDEIVVNYFFFGSTLTRSVLESDEGTLSWVAERDVLDRPFFDAIRLTLDHYLKTGGKTRDVLAGIVDDDAGSVIHLVPLRDMNKEGKPCL